MANARLRASKQGLTSAVNRINQAKEEYDHALQTLETTINSLDAVWEGKAQTEMKNKYESMRNAFKSFGEEIENYGRQITAFKNDLEERDSALAAQISKNII